MAEHIKQQEKSKKKINILIVTGLPETKPSMISETNTFTLLCGTGVHVEIC